MLLKTVLLVGGNILVLLIIFFYFKHRIDKALSTDEIVKTVREEVDQMIVELNQTTNRNIGLIEDSVQRLTEALKKADKRIVLLNKEKELQKKSEQVYSNIKPRTVNINEPAPAEEQTEEEPRKESNKSRSTQEKVMDLYRKGLSPSVIANKLNVTVGEIELIISIHGRKG
jgi:outer membrane biosynthesis protein TonB